MRASRSEVHAEAARDLRMHEVVTKRDLALAIENMTTRLTIRPGSMIAAAVPLTAGVVVLLQHVLH